MICPVGEMGCGLALAYQVLAGLQVYCFKLHFYVALPPCSVCVSSECLSYAFLGLSKSPIILENYQAPSWGAERLRTLKQEQAADV